MQSPVGVPPGIFTIMLPNGQYPLIAGPGRISKWGTIISVQWRRKVRPESNYYLTEIINCIRLFTGPAWIISYRLHDSYFNGSQPTRLATAVLWQTPLPSTPTRRIGNSDTYRNSKLDSCSRQWGSIWFRLSQPRIWEKNDYWNIDLFATREQTSY